MPSGSCERLRGDAKVRPGGGQGRIGYGTCPPEALFLRAAGNKKGGVSPAFFVCLAMKPD